MVRSRTPSQTMGREQLENACFDLELHLSVEDLQAELQTVEQSLQTLAAGLITRLVIG